MVGFGRGFHAPADRAVDVAAYDAYLGRWSRLFVPELVQAAGIAAGDRVLDVAIGPGEAALAIEAVGGHVVGLDIAEPMLHAARGRVANASLVAADALALPFVNESFDAVVCQLGLQFLPDVAAGLAEMRRVTRAGRGVAVSTIGQPERAPMWGYLAQALARRLPDQAQTLMLSFSLADTTQLEALFDRAGFTKTRVERTTHEDTLDSFDVYWHTVEAGVGMLPQAYRALDPVARTEVRNEVHDDLRPFVTDAGLALSLELLIATGRA